MDRRIEKGGLNSLVKEAWKAFECADLASRVHPAMPILFFGDLEAYSVSPIRMVTVGSNPSSAEFPEDSPFRRFPGCAGITAAKEARYLRGLCSYFHDAADPYHRWFCSYDAALRGAKASYYPDKKLSTALHTDFGSPVATKQAWSRLGVAERRSLQVRGGPLWHRLLEILKPQIVLLSVKRKDREYIEDRFPASSGWRRIHKFRCKKSGEPRKRPFPVDARWYEIRGEPSLFVWGEKAEKPFATLSDDQKRLVGRSALRTYGKGP